MFTLAAPTGCGAPEGERHGEDAGTFRVCRRMGSLIYMRMCLSPAVPSVADVELPEQIDDHQSCAAP